MPHLGPPFLLYIKSSSDELRTVLGRDVCDPSGIGARAGDGCGSGWDVDDVVERTKAGEGFGFIVRSTGDQCVREDAV